MPPRRLPKLRKVNTQDRVVNQFQDQVEKIVDLVAQNLTELNNAPAISPITSAVPAPANVLGATIVEDPANTRISRRLTYDDIDPAFVATVTLTSPSSSLVERGSTQSSLTATASYTGGTATSASIATTYAGATDGGDIALGAWSIPGSSYTSATAAGTVKRNAASGTDPSMTITLTASTGGVTKTATDTVSWTFRVMTGLSSAATPTESDVEALTYNTLKQSRNGDYGPYNPSSQYWIFAIPDLTAWTTGTPTFKDENGATFVMEAYTTVSITNPSGVTCNYRVYRSTNLLIATGRHLVVT